VSDTRSPRLVVSDSVGRRVVPIAKRTLTVGRRSACDVRVTGSHVSRLHAEITMADGVCTLRDAGSSFGTFVNGERTTEGVLVHGDRIRLGDSPDTEIVFLTGDDPPSARQSAVAAANELRHMAGLLEGLRALGSGRVLDDVLAIVLDSAIDITGAERGFVMLANREGQLEFTLARMRGRVTLSGRGFETSRKIPETVFATGREMIVEDLRDGGLADAHGGTVALGIRHVLCSPLRLVRYVDREDQRPADSTIGVMYLDSRERGPLQSAAARSALETLSAEAAIAIENARLYREAIENAKVEQELRVAAAIQRALLPPASRTGSYFRAAAASIPCRSVGGDFFDYVDLADGRVGWILGDVAGKGPPAALLAAAAIGMFGAEAAHHASAAEVMLRLNRGIFRRGIQGRFITAFYAVLSPDGALTYANAGHNPPVLVSSSGPRRLDTSGLILGVFEHATFDEARVQLAAGDVIVAFSDGVTEALNAAGEEFTDERLLAAIDAAGGTAPDLLLDAVVGAVRGFCGDATQSDDVTVVVVRYDGES